MLCRAWWLVGAAIACAGTARTARADEEVVELRYSAPPSCPSRAAVEAEIRERTPNVRIGAPARRAFAIAISASETGFRGTLSVGDVADRELAADRCEDLAAALALVTALAIDPTASSRPRVVRPVAAPSAWEAEAEAGALLDGGVGPGMMFAAVLGVRATWQRTYRLELAGIAGHDGADQDDARATFTWLAARPGGCRLWWPRGIEVGGCGHLEVGAVRAAGSMIVNQRDLTRLWLAAGAHASASYPIGARVFAQLQLGASVPFVRDRYLFAPNVTVHDTPGVTGWLGLGLGVRFP